MLTVERQILDLYNEGESPYQIAEKIPGFNHMKVRRLLKKLGVTLRDKGEAQSNALKTGRTRLPKTGEPSYNITKGEDDE